MANSWRRFRMIMLALIALGITCTLVVILNRQTRDEFQVSILKQKALENKPFSFRGKTLDGGDFDSASLKGKVILVNFWATWCGPCVSKMPRIIETYNKFHDQGLEVVGVSCDQDVADFRKYLKENPNVAWVQLFDEKAPGPHALTVKYSIIGIPTMFLVDRKGILRSVDARENMEELIPKLLAEK